MKSCGTQTIDAIATDLEKLEKILIARKFSIIRLTNKKYLSFFIFMPETDAFGFFQFSIFWNVTRNRFIEKKVWTVSEQAKKKRIFKNNPMEFQVSLDLFARKVENKLKNDRTMRHWWNFSHILFHSGSC